MTIEFSDFGNLYLLCESVTRPPKPRPPRELERALAATDEICGALDAARGSLGLVAEAAAHALGG